MEIQRSFEVQLYPTKDQEKELQKIFGAVRFIYNYYLALRTKVYSEENKSMSLYDCFRDLTLLKQNDDYAWLNDIEIRILREAIRDLDMAFLMFFKHKTSYPKFKSKKKSKKSFTTSLVQAKTSPKIGSDYIKLAKIGCIKRSRCKGREKYLKETDKMSTIRIHIQQSKTGKYYAMIDITYEIETEILLDEKKAVGIDVGLKHLAVLSDGTFYENPRFERHYSNQVKKAQQALSRKTSDSKNYEKAKKRLAKIHAKIAKKRKKYLKNTSAEIVSKYDFIFVESFNVMDIINKNEKYAPVKGAIYDTGIGYFLKDLEDKSFAQQKYFRKVPEDYASSKICHVCGYRNDNLSINEREWTCPECHSVHDRDINAAINIREYGMSLYKAEQMYEFGEKTMVA